MTNSLYQPHTATPDLADELGLDLDVIRRARTLISAGDVYLLGVCGGMAAGKDTVAVGVAELDGRTAVHLSLASAVKDEITEIIGILAEADQLADAALDVARGLGVGLAQAGVITGLLWQDTRDPSHLPDGWQRTPTVRTALQYWGTDVRRRSDPDYWVRKLMAAAYTAADVGSSVYVTDIRFPNEADAARMLGFTLVRLEVSTATQVRRLAERDGITVAPATLNHISERALDGYSGYDLVINNDDVPLDDVVAAVAALLPTAGGGVA